MNIFRLAGNMTHLMSVLVLLLKIHTIKSRVEQITSDRGVRSRSGCLWPIYALLKSRTKILESSSTPVKKVLQRDQSLANPPNQVRERIIEALSLSHDGYVDILPIFGSSCNTSSAGIVAKDKKYRQLDCSICFLLGAYRAFDILNWIYRYFTEPHCVHWITWISGLAQTLLYADFFYYYFNSWKNNVKLKLPA